MPNRLVSEIPAGPPGVALGLEMGEAGGKRPGALDLVTAG